MSEYNIRVLGITDGKHNNSFTINREFFEAFNNSEIKNTTILVDTILIKDGNKIKLNIKFDGHIHDLNCDLCASKINIKIKNSISIIIKISDNENEDTDEIIYINSNQSFLDISQLIFEGIELSIPNKIKHSGVNGDKCDKEMIKLINKYAQKEYNNPMREELNKLKI
tara:strand:+ start:9844 stop:10347 length:504 start_codon:yes stop_codon:yes gene_type:complete